MFRTFLRNIEISRTVQWFKELKAANRESINALVEFKLDEIVTDLASTAENFSKALNRLYEKHGVPILDEETGEPIKGQYYMDNTNGIIFTTKEAKIEALELINKVVPVNISQYFTLDDLSKTNSLPGLNSIIKNFVEGKQRTKDELVDFDIEHEEWENVDFSDFDEEGNSISAKVLLAKNEEIVKAVEEKERAQKEKEAAERKAKREAKKAANKAKA